MHRSQRNIYHARVVHSRWLLSSLSETVKVALFQVMDRHNDGCLGCVFQVHPLVLHHSIRPLSWPGRPSGPQV